MIYRTKISKPTLEKFFGWFKKESDCFKPETAVYNHQATYSAADIAALIVDAVHAWEHFRSDNLTQIDLAMLYPGVNIFRGTSPVPSFMRSDDARIAEETLKVLSQNEPMARQLAGNLNFKVF